MYNCKGKDGCNQTQNASYIEAIVKLAQIDFNESKSFETEIGGNGH
jgi:hypothetical protein